ncbi:MAG: response regulator [Elusimicrobia bacterium]|nr:response regulator [Elusimicrobiota bacterium]
MTKDTQQYTILLVEDNEDDILIAKRAFSEFRFFTDLAVARDGHEALDMLTGAGPFSGRKPLRPAMIFLDITLPLMDGIALLKRLKSDQALRTIPVVMLTTSSRAEDIARSYESGAASYLTKPASLEEFLQLARSFETYWISISRLPAP